MAHMEYKKNDCYEKTARTSFPKSHLQIRVWMVYIHLKWARVQQSHSVEPYEYEIHCVRRLNLMILINGFYSLSLSLCEYVSGSCQFKSHMGRPFCQMSISIILCGFTSAWFIYALRSGAGTNFFFCKLDETRTKSIWLGCRWRMTNSTQQSNILPPIVIEWNEMSWNVENQHSIYDNIIGNYKLCVCERAPVRPEFVPFHKRFN